jgi:predicted phosphodiesterase
VRIALMTDSHLLPSIGTRSDDYAAAILTKMKYVCEYAAECSFDLVIHCGDIFDRSVVPRWLEHSVLQLIDESAVRWAICCGTHDLGSGIPSTTGKSIFSLETHRNIYAFSGPGSVRVGDLLLCGACATDFWNTGAKIIAVHQMLTDVIVPWEHQPIDQVQTDAHYVLSGDYHPGWGAWDNERGTMFVNPGAISRTFRSPHDLTRAPSFAMIDTSKDKINIIPVPYAQDVYVEKAEPILEELRASVSGAIEDAKKKMGADDGFDLEGLDAETPAPLGEGVARLKELCRKEEEGE